MRRKRKETESFSWKEGYIYREEERERHRETERQRKRDIERKRSVYRTSHYRTLPYCSLDHLNHCSIQSVNLGKEVPKLLRQMTQSSNVPGKKPQVIGLRFRCIV